MASAAGAEGAAGQPLWPAGAATGVGSLPGTDPFDACRMAFDLVPDLPFVPELPARGAGAGVVGRTAAMLVELYVDLQPSGWRLVPRPGVDHRRARGLLDADLDALQAAAAGYVGPLKLSAAGPWTLAASVELPRGEKALADAGAVRDLSEALAEGLANLVADVRRRVPGARLLVQLDEPSLPAVLAEVVPTASGFSRLPAPEPAVAEERLTTVVRAAEAAGAVVGAHVCASDPPVALLHRVGAAFLSLDVALRVDEDDLGEAIDAGVRLVAGTVPAVEPDGAILSDPTANLRAATEPARRLWRRLGFGVEQLREEVAVSPSCGLAGVSPQGARALLRRCQAAARALVEEDE